MNREEGVRQKTAMGNYQLATSKLETLNSKPKAQSDPDLRQDDNYLYNAILN